jgi:hypothetical protein
MSDPQETTAPGIPERRRSQRVEIVAYIQEVSPPDTKIYFIDDISETGALLASTVSPPIGSVLNLKISIRLMPQDISVKARVVRHETLGFGIEFIEITEESLIQLRRQLYAPIKDRLAFKFNYPK